MGKVYGRENYSFGQKNNWRRWSWNQAKERITVPAKDAIVLYLPSKQNIDMHVATSKGFKPWNMFAVERDPKIVALLRKQKINIIDGDFNDVLYNWGSTPKIDIIMADFTGGLTKTSFNLMSTFWFSRYIKKTGVVLVLNLLRGRDPKGRIVREAYEDIFKDTTIFSGNEYLYLNKKINKKHRGFLWYSLLIRNFLIEAEKYGMLHLFDSKPYQKALFEQLNPVFNSYKSYFEKAVNVMDSVCITHPFVNHDNNFKNKKTEKVKPKIAAAKAVRTMRMNGKLSPIII